MIKLVELLDIPKDKWVPIPSSELKNYDKEILALIDNAYKPMGGHPNYNSPNDINPSSDYEVVDVDGDDEIDAVSVQKKRPFGNKFTATGHDGETNSKRSVIKHKTDKLKSPGYYVEVSGKIKDIFLAKGVEPISDEDIVRKILKGKDIEWVGDGIYSRVIGGKKFNKMLMGKPNL